MTTTRVTHATPAAAYAHAAERFWENDQEMLRARMRIEPSYNLGFGCKDIARQLVEDNPGINVCSYRRVPYIESCVSTAKRYQS